MSDVDQVARKLARGSVWMTISDVSAGVAIVLSNIIFARLVLPSEIGKMGLALLVLTLIEALTASGFEQALVQRRGEFKDHLDVAWTFHLFRGVLIAGCLLLAAPFVESHYETPNLRWVVWAMAFNPLIRSLTNTGMVKFSRQLDFKSLMVFNLVPAFARLLASIALALWLCNVWALVAATLIESLIRVALSFIMYRRRPRIAFDRHKFQELFSFGGWITFMSILMFFVTKLDDFFVSHYLGLEALAFYTMAYNVSNLPATSITKVISKVSFPSYAILQDDKAALRRLFIGVMKVTLLLTIPVSVFIYFAVPLFVDLLGEQWRPIEPIVQILVIGGTIRAFLALGGALFQGSGKPALDVAMNVVRFFTLAIGLLALSKDNQLTAFAWASTFSVGACIPLWVIFVRRQVGLSLPKIVTANTLTWVSGGIFLACHLPIRLFTDLSSMQLLGVLFCSTLAWLFTMWLLGRFTQLKLFQETKRLRALMKPEGNA